jgi:hypothetical protein
MTTPYYLKTILDAIPVENKPILYGDEACPMKGNFKGWALITQEEYKSPFMEYSSLRGKQRHFPHFWVPIEEGPVEQYQRLDWQSWMIGEGNSEWITVVTEGFHFQPLSIFQIDALAHIHALLHTEFYVPHIVADSTLDCGICSPALGGDSWGAYEEAPIRERTRESILVRAKQILGTSDIVYKHLDTLGLAITTLSHEVHDLRGEVAALRSKHYPEEG